MDPLIVYQRKARTHTDIIEELVAHVLRSSAWTKDERESLANHLIDSIDEWMDVQLKDSK